MPRYVGVASSVAPLFGEYVACLTDGAVSSTIATAELPNHCTLGNPSSFVFQYYSLYKYEHQRWWAKGIAQGIKSTRFLDVCVWVKYITVIDRSFRLTKYITMIDRSFRPK